MKLITLSIAGLSLLICQTTLAAGIYADLSIGHSDFPSVGINDTDFTSHEDTSSVSFSFSGGYSFNEYFSFEIAYNDLGNYSQEIEFNIFPFSEGPNSVLESDLTSTSFAFIPSCPVSEKWSLYAKLGQHSWDAKTKGKSASYENGNFVGFETTKLTKSDRDTFFGVGAAVQLTENFLGKISVIQYKVADEETDNISISIGYRQ